MFDRVPAFLRPFLERESAARISLRDRTMVAFLLVTAVWYTIAYLHAPFAPHIWSDDKSGWLGWADQTHYLDGANDLSQFELKPNKYFIGYELLAAPFYPFLPRHAFFIPDLILVLVMAGAFFASCRHCMSRVEAWLLVAGTFYFEETIRDKCLVVPWNTMPAYAMIYLVAYLLVFAPRTMARFILAAGAIAFALLARPTEVVGFAPLYLCAALSWPDPRKWRALGWFAAAVAAPAAVLVAINLYLYHTPGSPYSSNETHHFGFAHPGVKFYQLFSDGTFLTGNSLVPEGTRPRQMLERFPYLLFILPGALAFVRRGGVPAWGLGLAILMTLGLYLSYNYVSSPSFAWTYGPYHYYWWIMPWLALLTYLSFRTAPWVLSRRLCLAAMVLPGLLFAVVGFRAIEAGSTDDPALTVTSGYADGTFTINLAVTRDMGTIEDVRLYFRKPPDFFASTVANAGKIKLLYNGRLLGTYCDYIPSQQGTGPIDLSVLFHNFHVQAGDTLTITLSDTSEPVLRRVALMKVVFAPGRAGAHFFMP